MPTRITTKTGNAATASSSASGSSKKRKIDSDAQKFYAVRTGKKPGIYMTWDECQEQIRGFRGAQYKSFLSSQDAQDFVDGKNPSTATDGGKFYAVAIGKDPGIYTEWETASLAIKGWKGPKYKSFKTRSEAVDFMREHGDEAGLASIADEAPASKRSKNAVQDIQEEDEPGFLNIFTDGSSLANGKVGAVAGVGVYFGENDPRNVSERLKGEPQTNQRAELTAILRALQKVSVDQNVKIFSDSKYSINCVDDWYQNWERNGWKTAGKREDVKNKDIIMAVRSKIDERNLSGTKTIFVWVKGHATDVGNIAADELAVRGAKM